MKRNKNEVGPVHVSSAQADEIERRVREELGQELMNTSFAVARGPIRWEEVSVVPYSSGVDSEDMPSFPDHIREKIERIFVEVVGE